MGSTDSNLVSVARKDLELWERELIRIQRMGGFERAEEGPLHAHERSRLGPLGHFYAQLGQFEVSGDNLVSAL